MLGKVLKIWRRYLPPFLNYRENPEWGTESPPPQRGRGLSPNQGQKSLWTELNELNGGTWPPCPKLNWMNWQPTRSGRRTELNELFLKRFWTEFAWLRHQTTPRTGKQAQPAKRTISPSRWQTLGRRAGISAGGDLELLLTPPKQLEIQWTEPSQPGQSESGPEELVNWTECSELNGCTWPPCPELNWTNFPEKLVARKLNCTELMPNHFELWTRRPCKFTDSSGPGM